jgi:carbonic anhydrase/acetyltransferase-like protein (isoleucine patch superfamily)
VVPPLVVFEDAGWKGFLPLTYSRPLSDLRVGAEDFGHRLARLGAGAGLWCRSDLVELLAERQGGTVNAAAEGPVNFALGRGWWRRLPPSRPAPWVGVAGESIAWICADAELSARLAPGSLLQEQTMQDALAGLPRHDVSDCVRVFDWWWQLLDANRDALYADLPAGITVGEDADVRHGAVLDATDGPIWIGNGATIHGAAYVEGPACIGAGSTVLPQAAIRSGTSLGPVCKVGGEVEDSIFLGYSNKQHHGYVGHSVVGSWVNLGAGTTTSDLKSTYGTISTRHGGEEVPTGRQFLGAIFGDHAKTAIDVSINAGSSVGFSSAVFRRACPQFVPSLTWVTDQGVDDYQLERAQEVARRVMARRGIELTKAGRELFDRVRGGAPAIER